MSYTYKSAIASHVGMVRSNNQDSGFAGVKLFFVADGMGGHAGGDVASALTSRYVAKLDSDHFADAHTAATELAERLKAANKMLSETVSERRELAGMGTTFSGFITVGNKLAVAHIGDSRLYRYRKGELSQITADHTFVQKLVDSGQITEEEAKTHPRRSVLMRVLGDVDSKPVIDTSVLETEPDDVWLLCSAGLCGYVDEKVIRAQLKRGTDLQYTVDQLIDRALENGAPDNVTVALVQTKQAAQISPAGTTDPADTTDPAGGQTAFEIQKDMEAPAADSEGLQRDSQTKTDSVNTADTPLVSAADSAQGAPLNDTAALPVQRFVGSAANEQNSETVSTSRTKIILGRRKKKIAPVPEAEFEPRVDEYLAELIAETRRRNWRRRAMWALSAVCAAAILMITIFFAYQWTQTRYFVGTDGNTVIIYRGIQQNIGPITLSSEAENTEIPISALESYERRQVERTLSAESIEQAREIVLRLGVSDD